jgi:hypothetical protein
MISILYSLDGYHAQLILNVISQTIQISSNLLIIALPMTFSDVQSIEFLSVFFHHHQLLSQVLHSPKQVNLVVPWDELFLHLRNNSIPYFNLFLAFGTSIYLKRVPPQCCMSLQFCDSMSNLFIFFNIFIIEVGIKSSDPI